MYFNIIVTHTQSVYVCSCSPLLYPVLSSSGSLLPPNNAPPVFVLFIYTFFFEIQAVI